MKRSIPTASRRAVAACLCFAGAALGGCAAGPTAQPTVERVDERTAVTVVTMPKPLLYTGARGALGQPLDLSLGPVEINRMGEKTWFLWVALLGGDLAAGEPVLRLSSADERLVELAPRSTGFAPPAGAAPYPRPAAWATERYYEISAADLARLHGRRELTVELTDAAGQQWRFEPWQASAQNLDAFLERQLQQQLASR